MNKFWSRRASDIKPYTPGEQPTKKLVKLNTNENPYPPSEKVLEAIKAAANEDLRLYPQPESTTLCEEIAKAHGVSADSVFVGNGSDEILALCFLAYADADPQKPLRFLDVTYSFYPVYAALYGLPAQEIPVNRDFTAPVDKLITGNGPLFLANPNAPTSLTLPISEIEKILSSNPDAVLVLDEAYAAFSGGSAIPLTEKYPNLVVVRTFSKSHSLAGLRVGYAIAQTETLGALYAVKNSFNSYPLDRIAQAGAAAAIRDEDGSCLDHIRRIVATREYTRAELMALGFYCLRSASNFLFVMPPDGDAEGLMKYLREHDILVRRFAAPRTERFLRITIGTEEEMRLLLETIRNRGREPK